MEYKGLHRRSKGLHRRSVSREGSISVCVSNGTLGRYSSTCSVMLHLAWIKLLKAPRLQSLRTSQVRIRAHRVPWFGVRLFRSHIAPLNDACFLA